MTKPGWLGWARALWVSQWATGVLVRVSGDWSWVTGYGLRVTGYGLLVTGY